MYIHFISCVQSASDYLNMLNTHMRTVFCPALLSLANYTPEFSASCILMLAAQQVLLEHGAITNKADSDGVTPLLASIEAVHNSSARLAVVEVGAKHCQFQDSMCSFNLHQTCAFCLLPVCNQSAACP